MTIVTCVSTTPTTFEHLRRDSSASHSDQSTIHLFTHTSTHLSIHPSIYPTQPFIHPSMHPPIHPFKNSPIHSSICPPIHPHIQASIIYPSINPSSTHPSICLLLTHLSLSIYPHPLVPTHPGSQTTTFIVIAHSHAGRCTSLQMGHLPLVAMDLGG